MAEQSDKSDFSNAGERVIKSQFGGAPANAFFVPTVVVLAILNIIVVSLMFSTFSQSSKISQVTQNSSAYISEATSLLAGASMLSETSSNYVLMPLTTTGEPNIGPLISYTNEMGNTDHRGDQVLADFETYDVTGEALQNIREAAESANALITLQNHALALTCAVYPLPDIPALENLELPELTHDEAKLSDEEKIELARTLVLGTDWGTNKQSVSDNVNSAVANIKASTGAQAQATSEKIVMLRTLLIAVSVIIILFLCFAFVTLYRLLISPLGRFSRLIVEGDMLDDESGLREMRLLAGSYNDLVRRRDALESILREAAETDVLTGLPNRYSMQQHRLEAAGSGYSLTVFMFDVNNLKRTNDTLGHSAGDDLIKRAAYCISACFTTTVDGKCYRIAGDEFAAVIRGLEEGEIPALVERFEEMQKQNDVSISWGYAHAPEVGDASFKAMLDEADQQMYLMKEKFHSNGN